jgi:uncharacterized RDD family membrane protein YckC
MSTPMQQIPLPNPATQPEFFSGVLVKRLIAWTLDVIAITLISAIIATLPLFIGWFFFPLIFLAVKLVYCIGSISRFSATPGMRLMNIELRNRDGRALESSEAALHTISYVISMAFIIPQLITMALMVLSPKGQGLHDMFVGATVINSPSKH